MTEGRKRIGIKMEPQVRRMNLRFAALPVRVVDVGVPYEGDYEVTPDFYGRELATNGLRMMDDVTVHPIPIYDTDNHAGGVTIFIGGNF